MAKTNQEKRKKSREKYRTRDAHLRRTDPRWRARELRVAARKRAVAAGVPWCDSTMSIDRLEKIVRTVKACECCGAGFVQGTGHFDRHSLSIDRIRPHEGYVAGNVAVICWTCNNAKRDYTADYLRRVADWMNIQTANSGNAFPLT